jgi:hypothetical protein
LDDGPDRVARLRIDVFIEAEARAVVARERTPNVRGARCAIESDELKIAGADLEVACSRGSLQHLGCPIS